MAKKLSLLTAIAAVLGCIASASASAAPVLTKSPGVPAKVGEEVTLTSSNSLFTSKVLGNYTCEKVSLPATVSKNTGTEIELIANGKSGSTNCFYPGTKIAIPITKFEVNQLKSTASGKVTLAASFTMDYTEEIVCPYKATGLAGTYTAGSDSIAFLGGIFNEPLKACGELRWDAQFTVEIGSTPVTLD